MPFRLLALVLAVLAVPGAVSQTAVSAPVEADPADLARFVGEWVGGYTCAETGRHGTVVFRVVAGSDSIHAALLMIPRATEADLVPQAIPLAVHRVVIEGRSLSGVLARYDDPEWEMPLETSFHGALARDDHIEGFFRAVGTRIDTVPQFGRWWATRVSDRPLARLDLPAPPPQP